MTDERYISPVIFMPNVVNSLGDGWEPLSKFLGFRKSSDGSLLVTDPEILSAIQHWTVSASPTLVWSSRESYINNDPLDIYDRAVLRELPGKFQLKLLGILPKWLAPDAAKPKVMADGYDLGSVWKPEYSRFLYDFTCYLIKTYGDRISSISNGIEHSVEKLWSHGVKRLIEEVSRPVWEAVKDSGKSIAVIGFDDTMQGDDINSVQRQHSWRSAWLEWIDAGGLECCNRVGAHIYQSIKKDYMIDLLIDETLSLLDELGVYKTHTDGFYLTESGFSAWSKKKTLGFKCGMEITIERQADYWRRLVNKFKVSPRIKLISAYCYWMPEGVEDPYGLLGPDCSAREAFKILKKFWIENR